MPDVVSNGLLSFKINESTWPKNAIAHTGRKLLGGRYMRIGVFMSLNDPRWGRGSQERPEDEKDRNDADEADKNGVNRNGSDDRDDRDERNNESGGRSPRRNGPEDDLDQLWERFREMMGDIMGDKPGSARRNRANPHSQLKSRDDFSRAEDEADEFRTKDTREDDRAAWREEEARRNAQINARREAFRRAGERMRAPSPKNARFGTGLMAAALVIGWAASGFYIVPEGQSGIVTTFGRYTDTTMPGFRWHAPAPIQAVDLVDISSVRTAEIGGRGSANRLQEALMLTDDENIVDVQFTVQYRIKPGEGAKAYLFNTRLPESSVVQVAESAMREVVGRKTMDSILFESKAEIAEAVKHSMQDMLDRYGTGIEVMSVAIQNAQPPQPVQAAFNDAVKAGQDRERSINLGEAYMNAVLPKAEGTASRLREEAEAYKARVVETARGDADRFTSVFKEYQKAPVVTRDRMYLDAMRDVYANVTKVYVDQKGGSSLLYLPLDKIIRDTRAAAEPALQTASGAGGAPAGTATTSQPVPSDAPVTVEADAARAADTQLRERDVRRFRP